MSYGPEGPGWWQASDGRWYPPQDQGYAQQPAYGYGSGGWQGQPGPAPAKSRNGCLTAFLVVLALGVLGAVGACVAVVALADDVADEVSDDITEGQADEQDDVGEPTCGTDDVGDLEAVVDVTNDSSERSNYMITVAFSGEDGNQIDTGTGSVTALEPGQSTQATISTFTDAPAGSVTCKVTDVQRFSDEG